LVRNADNMGRSVIAIGLFRLKPEAALQVGRICRVYG
jgi:hypothetical protein